MQSSSASFWSSSPKASSWVNPVMWLTDRKPQGMEIKKLDYGVSHIRDAKWLCSLRARAFRICVSLHIPQPPLVSVTLTKGEHTQYSPSAKNATATRMKSLLTEGSHNTPRQKLPWTGSPHILPTESTHVGEQFTVALRWRLNFLAGCLPVF